MVPKILIVEDHEDSAQAMATLLRRAGHAVTVAVDYKEAISLAATDNPNIVLCDIGLPDGDGCNLLRQLKKQYDIKGIAVTGDGMLDDKERYLEAGFSEFVQKPCTVEQLKEAIVRVGLFTPRRSPPFGR